MPILNAIGNRLLLSTFLFIFGIGTSAFTLLYSTFFRKSLTNTESKTNSLSRVYFFTEKGVECVANQSSHSKKNCQLEECPIKNLKKIKRALKATKKTLDLCIYIFSERELIGVVKSLLKNGIRVRLVTDGRSSDDSAVIYSLGKEGARIQWRRDELYSNVQMHHKFVIIDGKILLNGSLNWTNQAYYGNFENIFLTSESSLVSAFQEEFDRLFFGSLKLDRSFIKLQSLTNCNSKENFNQVLFFSNELSECRFCYRKVKEHVDNGFCSLDVLQALLKILNNASESLDICMHQLTISAIGDSILSARERGVKVRYICDYGRADGSNSIVPDLLKAGVDVRSLKITGNMHHKWLIVDKLLLLNGSMNWTCQGICGNWENLVLTTHSDFVLSYLNHFEYLWNSFSPFEITEKEM